MKLSSYMMGQAVLRGILADIKASMWYSIIADEATDISHNDEQCLCLYAGLTQVITFMKNV